MRHKIIQLTEPQRESLGELWFIYGNRGPKHSMNDHKFIQGYLERARNLRNFYHPTAECVVAVDKVLQNE